MSHKCLEPNNCPDETTGMPCNECWAAEVAELRAELVPAYVHTCILAITCDTLDDVHGRECDRVNDEARTEHYAELVAEDVANLVRWHVAEAFKVSA